MYQKIPEGSIEFTDNKDTKYLFKKQNYLDHCKKRTHLKDPRCLKEIDDTICTPDCITRGPTPKTKQNYYKIFQFIAQRKGRTVRYWKIPMYRDPKLVNTWIIATAFDTWGFDFQIIHPLEKIIYGSI